MLLYVHCIQGTGTRNEMANAMQRKEKQSITLSCYENVI